MATLKAKQNATKVGKPSVTLSNRSPLYQTMYKLGETVGRAAQAKLEAALKFQKYAADNAEDMKDKDKRKAAIADAANGYDDGQASVPGNSPMSEATLEGLRSEFGSFIRDEVLEHANKGYAMIADIVKANPSKLKVSDAYQQRLEVNRAITAAKGAASKDDVTARLFKTKAEDDRTPKQKREAAIAKLIKECEAIIAAKLGLQKEDRDAIASLIATLKA